MSKSVGNVVEAFQLTDKYGHDAFRYFMLREMTFGLDASFSEQALVGRLNADLANDLGNLVSRATTMIVNFGGGVIRGPLPVAGRPGDVEDWESELPAALRMAKDEVERAMEEFAFQRALTAIWEFIRKLNRYVDTMQPWALAKEKDPSAKERLAGVLSMLGESLRCLSILLEPFLPDAAARIRGAVSAPAPRLEDLAYSRGFVGARVQKVAGLFPRVEVKVTDPVSMSDADRVQLAGGKISIDEFGKVELRVAEVVAAEKVAKSKKLLRLTVRMGEETRTLVAGVAEQYAPSELVGRKVVIVANLEPATLMGIESNGMVLAASHEGAVSLLTLDKDVPSGSKVK